MILFDTSVVFKMIKEGKFEFGAISIITLLEILRGIPREKREKVKHLLEESFDVIGINNEVILEYCYLYEQLKQKGLLIPDADLLIAACAKVNNFELRTMDKDFERLTKFGLKIRLVE